MGTSDAAKLYLSHDSVHTGKSMPHLGSTLQTHLDFHLNVAGEKRRYFILANMWQMMSHARYVRRVWEPGLKEHIRQFSTEF